MNYYWYIHNRNLKIVDEEMTDVTGDVDVTIRYWRRNNEALQLPALYTKYAIAYTAVPLPAIDADAEIVGEYVITVTPFDYGTGGTRVTVAPGSLLYVKSASEIYVVTPGSTLNAETQTAITGTLSVAKVYCYLQSDSWEQQDDGYNSDVQLTAAYYAASAIADLVGAERGIMKALYDRYQYRAKELKIRYNGSKYSDITLRPYYF